jgi:hypothetical protein
MTTLLTFILLNYFMTSTSPRRYVVACVRAGGESF